MNHHEIAQAEIVERYVQHKLSADERLAFQEHYFGCDECFAQVQTSARFLAGMQQAGRAGILDNGAARAAAPVGWLAWVRPAFAVSALASLVLAVLLGWLLVSRIPGLRGDLARERQAREQAEREHQEQLAQANEALANERQQRDAERAKLEELLAQNKPIAVPYRSQANSPLVILDSVRGVSGGAQQLVIGGSATSATVWIEVEPGNRFDSYHLQIFNSSGRLVESIGGAKPNSYNAVAVTVPSHLLHPGKYIVKLSGVKGRQQELVGEYDLNVRTGK